MTSSASKARQKQSQMLQEAVADYLFGPTADAEDVDSS